MKDSKKIVYGLLITITIYLISVFGARLTKSVTDDFIFAYMMVPLLDFALSAIAIYFFVSKGILEFKVYRDKLKLVIMPIILTLIATFLTVFLIRSLVTIIGFSVPDKPHVSFMNPIQILLFIFLFGSIAEETLFRGFLQNMLAPLKASGIRLFRIRLSLPVIISALLFGFVHLSLLSSFDDLPKLSSIVGNAIVMGLIAGYYQEKHDNFLFAIVVHMASNLPAVIISFLTK